VAGRLHDQVIDQTYRLVHFGAGSLTANPLGRTIASSLFMADPRTIQYRCRKTDGTGTAGPYLTPLFQAWAASVGLSLAPGTLNLCAHRDVELPTEYVRLTDFDAALNLPRRKLTPGYDPRLYAVSLQDIQPAWLFRWSDQAHLANFVGDRDGCSALQRCEVVAEVHLSGRWGLDAGAEITLRFS
jgi:hypothetical protein